MAISIPDTETYKKVDEEVQALADIERRSKVQMAVILIEEALQARLDREQKGR